MENIFKKYNSYVSLLINKSFLEDNKDILKEKDNLMFKGSSEDVLKYFKDNVKISLFHARYFVNLPIYLTYKIIGAKYE